ncbi:hypothetical protein [Streptomyces gardneri]|uniref:hypothetical protein n=1 Tax=Streptomyces gardneri TaxID=66892 RepID=UPI0035E17C67
MAARKAAGAMGHAAAIPMCEDEEWYEAAAGIMVEVIWHACVAPRPASAGGAPQQS